jgi:hypothetical protein
MQRWKASKAEIAKAAVQPGLFERRPRKSDSPATSRAAQRDNRVSGAHGRQCAIVLEYLRLYPDSTSAEMTSKAQVQHPTLDRYTFSS